MPVADIPAAKRAGLPVDLERLGRDGDGWLTPEDRYALKTHGVCIQAQPGVFMIRIRIAGGRLSPEQACGLADLAALHGESWIHLTTRQNIELHHVPAKAVWAVLAATEQLGLTNRSACGHTHRNVMSCPDAGVGLDEPFDCGPDARAVSAAVVSRAAELNVVMPSRLNFAFGGCPSCAHHARLNDGGFESVVVDGEAGYRLWAGGSLGTAPVLAVPLVDFIPRRHAVAAALALTEAFIAHGDLSSPKKGRLKFVLDKLGADGFRAAWQDRFDVLCSAGVAGSAAAGTGVGPGANGNGNGHGHGHNGYGHVHGQLDGEPAEVLGEARLGEVMSHRPDGGWNQGVRPQRIPGLAMVTVGVPLGDLLADELRMLAGLARSGDGYVYLTRNQNLQYRDVPVARVAALRAELSKIGLGVDNADSASDVRACTGSAVCALAITASPDAAARIARSPSLSRNGSLRIHVSGCPNSCAQHQAADIGLAGGKVRVQGRTRLGYTLMIAADVAAGRLAEPIGRVADDDVEAAVAGVIGTWEALRHPGERLVDTFDRVGHDAFAAHVTTIAQGVDTTPEPLPEIALTLPVTSAPPIPTTLIPAAIPA
jgi:sulfite reductase beta subunit-like hemoprotein